VFGPDGSPLVVKQPFAAWDDIAFATEARELTGTTFVAHVRHASTGVTPWSTPTRSSSVGGCSRTMGVVEGLDRLDARLAGLGVADLVFGETDSERVPHLELAGQIAAQASAGDETFSVVFAAGPHLPVGLVDEAQVDDGYLGSGPAWLNRPARRASRCGRPRRRFPARAARTAAA